MAQVAEAQVATLAQQKSYEVLRAPFAGTVTARFADPGALVQAATGAQTGALPLVTIATPEKLRVYVYVPQHDAGFVKVGDKAEVMMPDSLDAKISQGVVARRSDELDPRTRMMLVEVDLDNRDGRIVAGSFVTVVLTFATPPEISCRWRRSCSRARARRSTCSTARPCTRGGDRERQRRHHRAPGARAARRRSGGPERRGQCDRRRARAAGPATSALRWARCRG